MPQTGGEVYRLLIADDHAIVRDGLRAILKDEGFEVVGEASDGLEAIRLCEELGPDIAVVDISMPLLNGIDAARQILKASPKTKIVVLSMHTDKRYVLACLRAGIVAYVTKSTAASSLIQAIDAVRKGEIYMSISGKGRESSGSFEHSGTGGAAVDCRGEKCKGDWRHLGNQHQDR